MKLRIRGNTVRIRVSRTEMAAIGEAGSAQDAVEFGPGSRLRYRVQVVPGGTVGASYEDDCVTVLLPQAEVERWQLPEEVSITGEQPLGEGRNLQVLIEKDFACLAPREGEEDDDDLFPNPRDAGS